MTDFYRLDSFENRKFEPIKNLAKEEFVKAQDSVSKIAKYNQHFLVYQYFQRNLDEFVRLTKAISDLPVAKIDVNVLQSKDLFLNVNKVVFNLLGSFKFYLDSSETYLKRKYGKKSFEADSFIKLTNNSFDESFAYRFLSQLRDYSHHVGFPIHLMPFEATLNKENPESMIGDIKLMVELQTMLDEKKHINKILFQDLLKLTGDIDVKPLLFELGTIVARMEINVVELHESELDPSITFIESIARQHKTKTNKLVIMYDFEDVGQEIRFSNLKLPFDDIDQIIAFRKK